MDIKKYKEKLNLNDRIIIIESLLDKILTNNPGIIIEQDSLEIANEIVSLALKNDTGEIEN